MWYSLLALDLNHPDEILAQVEIGADSPWFRGHFPDAPILPGVAQLHMVAEVIARASDKKLSLQRLSRVKFKRPVGPGAVLTIRIHSTADDRYAFQIRHEDQDVCSGTMSCAIQR